MPVHCHPKQHRRKCGGALISALFITALAAMIATALAVEEALIIHEGTLAMNADNAYLALESMQEAANFAIQNYVLQWPMGSQTTQVASQIKPLQTPMSTMQIGPYTLSATIESAQSKLNINDLAYAPNEQNFVILLQTVMPTISKRQAYTIAGSITAWMMTGGDDAYYASLVPPYRSAKNQLTTITELRLIRGITPEIYTALAPYITALPIKMPMFSPSGSSPVQQAVVTPIDLNGASAPVLMAVNPGLNETQAESVVECRQQFGVFSSLQNFIRNCAQPSGVSNVQNLTVQSQYFSVHAETSANHAILSLNSLMVTTVTKTNKLKVMTVWQSFE